MVVEGESVQLARARYHPIQRGIIIRATSNVLLHIFHFEVPPRWTQEPQDTALMLGNAIVVNCQADGYPEPDISWFKGGKCDISARFGISSPTNWSKRSVVRVCQHDSVDF